MFSPFVRHSARSAPTVLPGHGAADLANVKPSAILALIFLM
jgi:hypothetical protein